MRTTDAEKDALRQAAEAAGAILPKLREQRENLDRRISHMEAVVSAYEATTGKKSRASADTETRPDRKPTRAKKGQVTEQIEAVLAGNEMTLKDIGTAIEQKFGGRWNRNTIYTAMHRDGIKFQRSGQYWKMNPFLVVKPA